MKIPRSLLRRAPWALIFSCAVILIWGMDYSRRLLNRSALKAKKTSWENILNESAQAASDEKELAEMRANDLLRFKKNLLALTKSKRHIYEWGLALQEENRLLEKQWEIMSSYLLINPADKTIRLMREGQALETYPVLYAPPQSFGGEAARIPNPTRITSKERFAHPGKGKVENIGGELVWNPPQVGSSRRANALGEYVLFAKGHLIFHGPALKKSEHEEYPHYCLGLSLHSAKELYAHTFIGTKIFVARDATSPAKKIPAQRPKQFKKMTPRRQFRKKGHHLSKKHKRHPQNS